MPSLFTRIIDGDLPGRFVHTDEDVVAFLTIAPIAPGHTLVVPRLEVDDWLDLPADLVTKVFGVAQTVGQAIRTAYQPRRVGVIVAGLEVPHVHVHVLAIGSETDLDFRRADPDARAEDLDAAADAIRAALA